MRSYFDEIDRLYGSFASYLREGLHLTNEAIESLRALVA
ncbi:tyrosine-protein phosphatase [Adlercreutzia sp. DFI.6.23]